MFFNYNFSFFVKKGLTLLTFLMIGIICELHVEEFYFCKHGVPQMHSERFYLGPVKFDKSVVLTQTVSIEI